MSIVQNSEHVKRKAQAAVATARLSGYKLISQSRTEKARVAARALSDTASAKPQAVKTRVQSDKAQVRKNVAQASGNPGKKVA